jgi:hypothetical protein
MQALKKISPYLLPVVLLILGLYLVPLSILNTDLTMIPGDTGDSRFNNYILEHGYKFLTGQVSTFWDAPFMYPYHHVTALSDNLIGSLPVYAVFRNFSDRETAFQLWILALYALNFICCFLALKKWSAHNLLSSVGAYIFAFSIFTVSQLHHAQVHPRFILPLVIYWCWKYLSEKKVKYFLFTLLGMTYQLYCGIYLGFLLLFIVLFFVLSYLVLYRDRSFFLQFKSKKIILQHLLCLVITIAITAPLMLPYIETSAVMGMRKFEDTISTIPQLRSYFFTFPGSKTWSPLLYTHSAYKFPNWWNHFLFIGALPWLAIIAVPFVLLSKKIEAAKKKFIFFLFLSLFLCFIFCLNIGGFTLYRFVFMLPGFSSMRSIDRVINTEIMLFVLVFVFVFKELSDSYLVFKRMILLLPVLVVIDNLTEPKEIKRYEKSISQAKIADMKLKITSQYDKNYSAIAFFPIETYEKKPEEIYYKKVETQLTIMLAAQEANIACVNGYTGFYPDNYDLFFYSPSDKTLADWCRFAKGDVGSVQKINEFRKKERYRKTIHLKAFNNKFLSAAEGQEPIISADRDATGPWETFTLICFENGQCLLRANTDLFFSAQLDKDGEVTASRPSVAAWQTFALTDVGNNMVTFKAYDNSYLGVDRNTLRLYARSKTAGVTEQFLVVPY